MKISILLIGLASIAIATMEARAQTTRTFTFTNRGDGHTMNVPIYNADGSLLAGTGYLAQLYVGANQNSLQPLLPVKSFMTGGWAGYLLPSVIAVDGLGVASDFAYQIRAWDASLGSTYAEAVAQGRGGVGESNIATESAGFLRGGPPSVPGSVIGLQSFSLSPLIVPEPSTYALLGVGVVALGWQRRRNGRACSGPASQ